MSFNIPIVFFIFKRKEKSLKILERISKVKPEKLYLISDYGRTEEEIDLVEDCRKSVIENIDWECEVIKDFAKENMGCYDRIGLGALRVFEKEPMAIFLEDDNLPQISFFYYCQEMLEKYYNDDEILWVCGTNYLGKYKNKYNSDYIFSKHMFPCGWASWSHKFTKYYDKDFLGFTPENLLKIKKTYSSRRMYRKDCSNWRTEITEKKEKGRYASWDYQMSFSIRLHNKLGVVPCYNQITNIGVDSFSEHGGSTLKNPMTKRFCELESYEMEFPLKHPHEKEIDENFEKKIDKIEIPPLYFSVFCKTTDVIYRAISRFPALLNLVQKAKKHLEK